MTAIGIDIGGTHTKLATVDDDGRVFGARRFATPLNDGGGPLIARLVDECVRLWRETTDDALAVRIGLALPGLLDDSGQRLRRSINLSCLTGRPVGDILQDRIASCAGVGVHVTCLTDAHAAAWGEYRACRPAPKRFAHLRLGTGVAFGVVLEGRHLDLDRGRDTHLTALVVDATHGESCPCGLRGCLETTASGPALLARLPGATDLLKVQQQCEQSDSEAQSVVRNAARAVHLAINNLIEQYDVSLVTLGGGVVETLPALWSALSSLRDDVDTPQGRACGVCVKRATLGDLAGVVGAAQIASSMETSQPARA